MLCVWLGMSPGLAWVGCLFVCRVWVLGVGVTLVFLVCVWFLGLVLWGLFLVCVVPCVYLLWLGNGVGGKASLGLAYPFKSVVLW